MYTPGNPGYVTKDDAERCLKAVTAWLELRSGPETGAALYVDHEGPYWNIACEGVLYGWPWLLSQDDTIIWPDGVHVEAGTGWSLNLHPVRAYHDPTTHLPPWCGDCRIID